MIQWLCSGPWPSHPAPLLTSRPNSLIASYRNSKGQKKKSILQPAKLDDDTHHHHQILASSHTKPFHAFFSPLPVAMGVVRTKTIKNKHAAGGASSKSSSKRSSGPDGGAAKSKKPKGTPPSKQVKDKGREALLRKLKNPKKRTYTDEQLGIPTLNKITPVGVVKPRGKKKGKVFVDDRVWAVPFCVSPPIAGQFQC